MSPTRHQRQRERFVREVERNLLVRARRTVNVGVDAIEDRRVEQSLMHDLCTCALEELNEIGHQGRVTMIHKFLERLPIMWAAHAYDVAIAIHIERVQEWGRYADDDPRWEESA